MFETLKSLFGCHHRRYSFPHTDRVTKQTTVCCEDCKRRIAYDWQTMRVVRPVKVVSQKPKEARTIA